MRFLLYVGLIFAVLLALGAPRGRALRSALNGAVLLVLVFAVFRVASLAFRLMALALIGVIAWQYMRPRGR